jgi:membrane protease YdiL (CAAX protease family)
MPPVDLLVLTTVDVGLHVFGVLIGLAAARTLWRRHRLANPLADVLPSGTGPELPHVVLVIFAYLLAMLVLVSVAGRFELTPTLEGPPPRGSPGWHLRVAADHGAKLMACVLIVYVLWRRPSFAESTEPLRRSGPLTLVAVASTVALIAVTTVQYQMVMAIWRGFDPAVTPPEHHVLEALQRDPAPPWGALHLTFQAVIVAPLVEELFFRGLLLQSLWRLTGLAWPAVLLSAALFGLVHLPVPQSVLPLVTMGCVLGYLRLRHRSLGLCIAVHVLFNLRTMSMVLLNPQLLAS